MRYLHHVRLVTGYGGRSTRDEVDDQAIARFRSLIAAGGGALEPDGNELRVEVSGRCLTATVHRSAERGGELLATIGVAEHSRCGAALWRRLHQDCVVKLGRVTMRRDEVPPEPWSAACLEAGAEADAAAMRWLGDIERCLSWAWLVEVEQRTAARRQGGQGDGA